MHWRENSARQPTGGTADYRALRSDLSEPYPLPAQSLRPDPVNRDTRERAALSFVAVFFAFWFFVPMILAGVMMHFR